MASLNTQNLGEFLIQLRDIAAAALTPAAALVAVYPGTAVAFDGCCDGQVWSRLASMEPRIARPTASGVPCLTGWTATIEVGALRCAAVLDDDGEPPPASALDADSMQEVADMVAIQQALLCEDQPVTLTGWVPLGAEGACVGGAWTMTAIVGMCDCQEG